MGSRDVARGQNAIQDIIDKLGRDNANRVELVQIDGCQWLSMPIMVNLLLCMVWSIMLVELIVKHSYH